MANKKKPGKSKQQIRERNASKHKKTESRYTHKKKVTPTKSKEGAAQKQSERKGPKFEFSIKNPKFRALLPFAAAVIFFLLIWTEPKTEVRDPWYEAAYLIDSAKKVNDPQLKQKLLDKGGSQLQDLVKKHPYHARVHFLLGYYYLSVGKWDSAIARQKQAYKMDSGSTINPVYHDAKRQLILAVINKSNEYAKQGDFQKALETLNTAKEYDPHSAQLRTQYGVIFHRQGKLNKARNYYEKALQYNKNHRPAIQNLGLLYFQLGNNRLMQNNYTEAINLYNKSVSMQYNKPQLFNNLGIAYMRSGQNNEAIKAFEKTLTINQNEQTALRNLTKLYSQQGNIQAASKYQKRLRALN